MISTAPAHAGTLDFNYTGKITTYTVPQSGTYTVTAYGAEGGTQSGILNESPGLGAQAQAVFNLTKGEKLGILVGGQGGGGSGLDGGGGGGGGSFIVFPGMPATGAGCSAIRVTHCADTLLLAAGGGGGAGSLWSGSGGQTTTQGSDGHISGGGPGFFGGGGGGGAFGAGGGGGYVNDGLSGSTSGHCDDPGYGCGGLSFEDGGAGSRGGTLGSIVGGTGGFGGGGGGAEAGGGGGGGGYSGGGGADIASGGGGGGSYIDPALALSLGQLLDGGVESGPGLVTITFVAAPEPRSVLLMGAALLGLAGLLRLRRST